MTNAPGDTPGIWERLWRMPVARAAMVILAIMTVAAIVGPSLMPAGAA